MDRELEIDAEILRVETIGHSEPFYRYVIMSLGVLDFAAYYEGCWYIELLFNMY